MNADAAAGAPWGAPLQRLDRAWTGIEQRLATWALVGEIVTLSVWVSLKGLASPYHEGGSPIGLIFRAVLSATVLGLIAHALLSRRFGRDGFNPVHAAGVTLAVVLGAFVGRAWTGFGVEWSSNVIEWLQNASVLMLIGGPRGLVTRLTLWLALLGASMAASKGKHINIDLATRHVPPRLVKPVAIIGWLGAALVCFAGAVGFVDSIAVTKFRAEASTACRGDAEGQLCDTGFLFRLGKVTEGARTDFFLLRRQLSLDVRSAPRVLVGEKYDGYLGPDAWNTWVKDGGWENYFAPEAVLSLLVTADSAPKMPAVVAPDSGEGRDLLIRDLNFILPFGLMMVGLKFLLRILLLLAGFVKVDAHGAHDDEDLKVGQEATS